MADQTTYLLITLVKLNNVPYDTPIRYKWLKTIDYILDQGYNLEGYVHRLAQARNALKHEVDAIEHKNGMIRAGVIQVPEHSMKWCDKCHAYHAWWMFYTINGKTVKYVGCRAEVMESIELPPYNTDGPKTDQENKLCNVCGRHITKDLSIKTKQPGVILTTCRTCRKVYSDYKFVYTRHPVENRQWVKYPTSNVVVRNPLYLVTNEDRLRPDYYNKVLRTANEVNQIIMELG